MPSFFSSEDFGRSVGRSPPVHHVAFHVLLIDTGSMDGTPQSFDVLQCERAFVSSLAHELSSLCLRVEHGS
jgi:hypothetical protein